MLRVVLDTSVVASAFRSQAGASFVIIRAVRFRRLVLLATISLFLEYEEVLKSPEQRRVSGLSLADVDQILGTLAVVAEPVDLHFRWRPRLRDADDEMVLEAAINGRADALVTYNVRNFASAAPRFGVRIVRPADLLQEMAS